MTDSLPILPDDLPFFTGISPDKRMAMLTCLGARVRTVRKGEFLVLAQDEVRYIGIVLSGEIHMIHEDRWGDKAVLAVIRSGGLFGETFVCGTVSIHRDLPGRKEHEIPGPALPQGPACLYQCLPLPFSAH